MIRAPVEGAVAYYNHTENSLKEKSNEELEEIIHNLEPTVRRDNRRTGIALGVTAGIPIVGSLLYKAYEAMDFLHNEQVDNFLNNPKGAVVLVGSLLLSLGYCLYQLSGKRLEKKYTYAAAKNMLEK